MAVTNQIQLYSSQASPERLQLGHAHEARKMHCWRKQLLKTKTAWSLQQLSGEEKYQTQTPLVFATTFWQACVPDVNPKNDSRRRHRPGKTKRKLYSIKSKHQRSIHMCMLKCFRGKLSLDRPLKLRIFAAALALLNKLSEALLARMPDHHIMAAALLNCAFGLEGLRDNERHQAAELCCRKRLGVALQKGSAERQTFALYKTQLVQSVCNDQGL